MVVTTNANVGLFLLGTVAITLCSSGTLALVNEAVGSEGEVAVASAADYTHIRNRHQTVEHHHHHYGQRQDLEQHGAALKDGQGRRSNKSQGKTGGKNHGMFHPQPAVESPSSAKTPSMVALDGSKGVGALSFSMPVNPVVKVGTGPSESRLGKRDVLVLGDGALNPNQGVVEEEDEEGEDEEGEDGEMVIGSMGVKKKHHKHHGLSNKKGGAKDDAGSGGGGAVNELDVTKGNGDDATAAGDNGNPSDPNDVNIGLEGDDLNATMREKKHRKGHKTKIGQEDSQGDDDVALGNNGAAENGADTEVDIEGHKHKHKDDLLDNGFGSTVDFGKGGTTATGPLAVKKDPKSPPQQVPASVAPKTAPASQVHQAPQAPQAPPPPPAAGAPGQTSSDEGKYSGPSDRAPPPMGDKKSNGKSTGDESDYGTVPMFGPAQLELSNEAMGSVPTCARWISGGAVVLASLWMLMG